MSDRYGQGWQNGYDTAIEDFKRKCNAWGIGNDVVIRRILAEMSNTVIKVDVSNSVK